MIIPTVTSADDVVMLSIRKEDTELMVAEQV